MIERYINRSLLILKFLSGILKNAESLQDSGFQNRFAILRTQNFSFGKFSCFKLRKITDVYSGKIYDVDVPNDIILVKRDRRAVWSGNSNGKFSSALEFDGNDWVFVDDNFITTKSN
ncbi:MAG: hypothetical protein U9Q22_04435 [Candidatus Altiarchaeota archaeon]|nr:hypothetical protein [Candidatus Altiarchaeota archaeon]